MKNSNKSNALSRMLKTVKPVGIEMIRLVNRWNIGYLNTDSHECNHSRQCGSEYGSTCMDCGTNILGFGLENTSKECVKHEFKVIVDEYDSPLQTFCVYCKKSWMIPDVIGINVD